jgi:hypothetical protein
MSLANDTQRALGKHCGDRYIAAGDYRDFDHVIDYPCKTGLSPAAIDEPRKRCAGPANLALPAPCAWRTSRPAWAT